MNSFGRIFRITTWGESHGKAVGVVIDGCPSGLKISEEELSQYLKKTDRPNKKLATERMESNKVRLLSGILNGMTLGTPICIIIKNDDIKKNDYKNLKQIFRPGHGDYTYCKKYNIKSITGGGRGSGRVSIVRIAAGYIAGKLIKKYYHDYKIKSKIISLAGIKIFSKKDKKAAFKKAYYIGNNGDSTGGIIKFHVKRIAVGIGEPVFEGIDAKIAQAVLSMKSVKSIEFGIGKKCADLKGSENNDEFNIKKNELVFTSNNSGGSLSGITTGQDIIFTISVKPTPSIEKDQTGLTLNKKIKKISTKGRHDKNITPRMIPIVKAMINLVIADFLILSGKIQKDRLC